MAIVDPWSLIAAKSLQAAESAFIQPAKGHVYGKIDNAEDLKRVYAAIRQDVAKATTRPELTALYRRAGYLVTLTYSLAWEEKFDPDEIAALRQIAHDEFHATAEAINARAEAIGTAADYDETWGKH